MTSKQFYKSTLPIIPPIGLSIMALMGGFQIGAEHKAKQKKFYFPRLNILKLQTKRKCNNAKNNWKNNYI